MEPDVFMYYDRGDYLIPSTAKTQETTLFLNEAVSRGFEVNFEYSMWTRFPRKSLINLGDYHKGLNAYGELSTPGSRRICGNKNATKQILKTHGVKTPEGCVVRKDNLKKCYSLLDGQKSFVLKPVSGSKGEGVQTGIKTQMQLDKYFSHVSNKKEDFIFEKEILGKEFRALVVAGKLLAVTCRTAPYVRGDGKQTLKELISEFNARRKKNPHTRTRLVKFNSQLDSILSEQNLTLPSVIPEGDIVRLSYAANFSTGGSSIDVTDQVSQEFTATCERAVSSIPGLLVCGVDVIVTRAGEPYVIELNSRPMLGSHMFPGEGKSRNVAADVMDLLLPGTTRQTHRIYFEKTGLSLLDRLQAALRGNLRPKLSMKLPCKDPSELRSWRVVFSGHLQGVGFRAHVRKVARQLDIHGHVQNMPDGTVEAICCGTVPNLEKFIQACKSEHHRARVDDAFHEDVRHVVFAGFRIIK